MTERYLLYSRHGHRTAKRIAQYLGLPHGRDPPGERQDYLLRWGTSQRVDYVPDLRTWNLRRAIEQAADKYRALTELDAAGVPVPPHSRHPSDLDYPMLGRDDTHSQGRDIDLILQERDITGSDYYVEYIPTAREYRVHVVNGQIVRTTQKVPEGDVDPDREAVPWMRNHDTGWIFVDPRDAFPGQHIGAMAVDALDLDFGAVDMIVSESGDPYVLEVNTAPSLNDTNLELYCEQFEQMLELDNVPGMDAVDWTDRDDVNTEQEDDTPFDGTALRQTFRTPL